MRQGTRDDRDERDERDESDRDKGHETRDKGTKVRLPLIVPCPMSHCLCRFRPFRPFRLCRPLSLVSCPFFLCKLIFVLMRMPVPVPENQDIGRARARARKVFRPSKLEPFYANILE